MTRDVRTLAVALALGALAVAAYLPALRNGFVGWDDDLYVVNNTAVAAPDGLRRIWSTLEMPPHFPNYPLVFTTYWLEYRLWGLWPSGYHATNVLLHGLNTSLVFLLLLSMGVGRGASSLAAAVFALHPMQVESVAWISERKNVLSALFSLAAFVALLRYRCTRRGRWYGAALLGFVCALLSKTTTATLPLSVVVFERVRDGRWTRAGLWRAAPMLALGAGAGLVTLAIERQPAGTPIVERSLAAAAALWFYVGKLLLPLSLLPLYPRWDVSWTGAAWWLPLLGVAAVAAWAVHRGWQVRWGLAHFFFVLLPVLGLRAYGFNEYSFVSDRNVYVACIGVLLLVAVALGKLCRVSPRGGRLAVLGVLVGLWSLTWAQIPVWQDSVSLWTAVLAGNPRAAVAHANLSVHFFLTNDLEASERHARQALALNPDSAQFHKNLAVVLQRKGRLSEAETEARRAQALRPAATHEYVLGTILAGQDRVDEASAAFQRALALDADLNDARNELGRMLLAAGRIAEAVDVFAEAIRRDPGDAAPRYNLALALAHLGRLDEAIAQLEEVVRLEPGFAAACTQLDTLRRQRAAQAAH